MRQSVNNVQFLTFEIVVLIMFKDSDFDINLVFTVFRLKVQLSDSAQGTRSPIRHPKRNNSSNVRLFFLALYCV